MEIKIEETSHITKVVNSYIFSALAKFHRISYHILFSTLAAALLTGMVYGIVTISFEPAIKMTTTGIVILCIVNYCLLISSKSFKKFYERDEASIFAVIPGLAMVCASAFIPLFHHFMPSPHIMAEFPTPLIWLSSVFLLFSGAVFIGAAACIAVKK